MKNPREHVCWENDKFEISIVGYPRLIYRCPECRAILKDVPVDDAEGWQFEIILEMICRCRRIRRDEGYDAA